MRRIGGLSNRKPLKKPAAKVRRAPPKGARKVARKRPAQLYCSDLLGRLFRGYQPDEIKVWGDRYPAHMRANLQPVIAELFMANADHCIGAIPRYSSQDLSMGDLMSRDPHERIAVGPVSHVAIDTGEDQPVRCARNALILKRTPMPHAIFIFVRTDPGGDERYVDVEIAVPRDHPGSEAFAAKCLAPLEDAIEQCRAYRGKVLSLEKQDHYSGRVGRIQVHRLKPVQASEVILPAPTKKLLDRCVLDFMAARGSLRSLGFQTKRGILLYGPPGTGKTHTIRYLAGNLPGTTTLLITAEQVGLLPHYMSLARLLQPSMVVVEDVDLIARSRERTRSACDESLLNSLLNEMDGLKENSDILFILTTNRPQDLEAALANRPGRIDQAIEVPVPDSPSRDKLVRLYGNGLKLGNALVAEAVKRTDGVSAAFIKELMRRTVQSAIARGSSAKKVVEPTDADLGEALDDMLFAGGQLNVRLLGGVGSQRP
ncbi:MAG TPA: ATP-binding protein [Dongiaceae bacterium]|nr:ATP-binding protein [Dongiaceae bacterium]